MELEDGLDVSGAGLGPAGGGSGVEGVGAGHSDVVGSPAGAAAEEDAANEYGHKPAAAEPEQAADGLRELSSAAQLCVGSMQPWAETLSEAHSRAGQAEWAIPLRQGRIRSGRVAKRTGLIRMRGQRGPPWEWEEVSGEAAAAAGAGGGINIYLDSRVRAFTEQVERPILGATLVICIAQWARGCFAPAPSARPRAPRPSWHAPPRYAEAGHEPLRI